jgi:signal peptide peptidase SppA
VFRLSTDVSAQERFGKCEDNTMSESAVKGRGTAPLLDQLSAYLPERWRGGPVVPVVRLAGTIGAVTPLRPGMTLAGVAKLLDRAFATRNARAVALVINSPGGSPVQSRQIYLRIRQLAAEQKIPVLVFVEDVAASGGYMLACAGDEIFCDPSSILGSIGVVGGTFGFAEAIRKIGVERRIYTSGEHKAMLDPFLPEDPGDVARLRAIQNEIHQTFIALVKERRGARLRPEANLFSGEYWAGETSVAFGLADGIGDLRSVVRARYGDTVRMPVIAARTGMLSSLLGRRGATESALAGSWADEALSTLETRAIWARFGF